VRTSVDSFQGPIQPALGCESGDVTVLESSAGHSQVVAASNVLSSTASQEHSQSTFHVDPSQT
jgi:hypothetical protein